MKRLLSLGLLLSVGSVGAQTFEWNKAPRPAAHPKEVQLDQSGNEIGKQDGLAGVYDAAAEGTTTAYGETYNAQQLTGSHPALPPGTLLRVTNTENGRTVVVRVTDKGRECADCLITLSQAAAEQLGISGRSTVSLEQTGFSNWNPVPPATPAAYSSTPLEDEPGVIAPRTVAPAAPAEVSPTKPSVIGNEVTVAANDLASEPTEVPQTYNRYPVTPPSPTVPGAQQSRGGEVTAPAPVPAPAPEVATAAFSVQLAAYHNEANALRRVKELKEEGLGEVYYRSIKKDDGQVVNRVYAGKFTNVTDAQRAAKEILQQYKLEGIVAEM